MATTPAAAELELAQAALNRAVTKWARERTEHEGNTVERILLAAFKDFQLTAGQAFNEAAKSERAPKAADPKYFTGVPTAPAGWAVNTGGYPPRYDAATELRIANLLAVVSYPHPIPSGDLVRKAAVTQALEMLGLDTVPAS